MYLFYTQNDIKIRNFEAYIFLYYIVYGIKEGIELAI